MRLIDAEKTIKRLQEWNTNDVYDKALFNFAMNRIIEQPIVEAEPVVHGKWIVEDKGLSVNANTWQVQRAFLYKCSLCGYSTGNQGKYFKFCPNCGANMMDGKSKV